MRQAHEPTHYCPYNPSHQMRKNRMLWHLAKGCQSKKELEKNFRVCPYYALHILPSKNYQGHLLLCEYNVTLIIQNENSVNHVYKPLTDVEKKKMEIIRLASLENDTTDLWVLNLKQINWGQTKGFESWENQNTAEENDRNKSWASNKKEYSLENLERTNKEFSKNQDNLEDPKYIIVHDIESEKQDKIIITIE